jgi:phosphatidate phosphatase APP1
MNLLRLCLLSLFLISADVYAKAIITAYDTLTSLGRPVELRAKLERDQRIPFRRDLPGEELVFLLNGEELGRATTTRDGLAYLFLRNLPQAEMTVEFQVILSSASSFSASPAVASLSIWRADRQIVVTDIDQTISNTSNLNVVRLPVAQQAPFPYAREVLQDFADQGVGIIYLTAREDVFSHMTRAWLEYHGFPKGHLSLWDLSLFQRTPWNHGRYKTEKMRRYIRFFPNILFGIGDKVHDLEAYNAVRVPALFMRSDFNLGVPTPGYATDINHWSEVLDFLN